MRASPAPSDFGRGSVGAARAIREMLWIAPVLPRSLTDSAGAANLRVQRSAQRQVGKTVLLTGRRNVTLPTYLPPGKARDHYRAGDAVIRVSPAAIVSIATGAMVSSSPYARELLRRASVAFRFCLIPVGPSTWKGQSPLPGRRCSHSGEPRGDGFKHRRSDGLLNVGELFRRAGAGRLEQVIELRQADDLVILCLALRQRHR